MLRIRLQRVGRRHEPSFRLVLTDSHNSTKSGRFKEILGSYDPRKTVESLETERIKHWLSQGANPTDTVRNLLIKKGIVRGKKIGVHSVSKNKPEEAKEESPKEEPVVPIPESGPAPEAHAKAPVESPVEVPTEAPVASAE